MPVLVAFALFLVSRLYLSGTVLQPVHKQLDIGWCSFVAIDTVFRFLACSAPMSLLKPQNRSGFLAS